MTAQNIEISLALVKSSISTELARTVGVNYQKQLQKIEDIVVSKQTIQEAIAQVNEVKKIQKALSDMVNPHTEKWQSWNKAKKSIEDPICEILKEKDAEIKKVANAIQKEIDDAENERLRIQKIKYWIDTILIDFSQKIAAAETIKELLHIERLLNLETAYEEKYSEFLPVFKLRCEGIRGLLTARKEQVKELTVLDKNEQDASLNGNDDDLEDILDRKAVLNEKLEESAIQIQELASNQAIETQSEIATLELPELKAKSSRWKYEVFDIQLLAKKHPEFVTMIPNNEAIKNHINKLKENKTIKEQSINGLRIFLEKSY